MLLSTVERVGDVARFTDDEKGTRSVVVVSNSQLILMAAQESCASAVRHASLM